MITRAYPLFIHVLLRVDVSRALLSQIGHQLTDSRSGVVTESAHHVLVIADIATFPAGTTEDEMQRAQPSCCSMITSDFDVILNGPQHDVGSLRGVERLRADLALSAGVRVCPIPLSGWKVKDFAAQSTESPDSVMQRQLLRRLLTLNTGELPTESKRKSAKLGGDH